MHDLLTAAAFILMLLAPCFVASHVASADAA